MSAKRRPIAERFWEKVDKRGPNECWPWTACRTSDGYGQISEGTPSRKMLGAHCVSYEIHNGSIPPGEGYHGTCVCHTCDNPPCVNPAHLFLGTIADDLRDMRKKGRGYTPKREAHGRAKLTEGQVIEIRRDYVKRSRTYGTPALARKYNVSHTAIWDIVRGENWK